MLCSIRQHSGRMKESDIKKTGLRQIFGRKQYLYEHEDGTKMDIISFEHHVYGINRWEIYGGPLPDVERYNSKGKAELRIMYLLYVDRENGRKV